VLLIPHLKAFTTEIKNLFPGNNGLYSISLRFQKTDISQVYQFFAETLHRYCSFSNAIEFHEASLQIWKDFENEHFVSSIYTNIGELHRTLGNLEKAKGYHKLSLEIYKEQLGPNHTNVATSYNNLGSVYYDMGNLEKAKEYHQLALEINKEQLGPNHTN
jgi:tetratricopeptide (TPR) repeat protein